MDTSARTRQFLDQLEREARSNQKDVTLFVSFSVQSNPVVLDTIKRLGTSISVVARKNYEMAMTEAEAIARKRTDADDPIPKETAPRSLLRGTIDRLLSKIPATIHKNDSRQSNRAPATKKELQDAMYRREYRRIFGDSEFDEIVKFNGLSLFWKKLAEHAIK